MKKIIKTINNYMKYFRDNIEAQHIQKINSSYNQKDE